MSKITVKVKADLDRLREIRDNLHANTQRLIRNTIDEAEWVADELIGDARRWSDGNDDAHLITEEGDLSASLKMYGSQCLFIEYGAGDLTLYPYYPGEYSEKHAKQYSTQGFWYYDKERYTGIPAYRPMFTATQKAWQYIEEHGQEVFK